MRVFKDRKCVDCPNWFTPDSPTRKRCERCSISHNIKRDREYRQKPEVKYRNRENQRTYRRKPKAKERYREYKQKPEVKERGREFNREYRRRPEIKQRYREYNREHKQKPEVKERIREYQREYQRLRTAERATGRLTQLIKELARITKELDSGKDSNRKS